jgi:hypothetical protein
LWTLWYPCEKSHSTLCRTSWVFRHSGFLQQGMLTGLVGINPQAGISPKLTLPAIVAVLHDQTWVIRWLPEAPLERAVSFEIQLSSQLQVRIT